jgi:GNAT superfamily N-acetyltransferase
MRAIAHGQTEQFLVMEKAGEMIAALAIFRHWLRVGSTKVLKGDIGEVAVLRELQGQGFGTQLMQGCVRHLRENGFLLSRLGGLNRFYARFGYVPFPRRYYEFLLTDARAGASTISPEQYLAIPPEQEQFVRLYYPHRDWRRIEELYDHFNHYRTGSLVKGHRSTSPPDKEPASDSLNFVFEEDGCVSGYLFASEHPEENSPFEAKMQIGDVAFQMDKPETLKLLMRYALREAARRGIQRVTARLPFDPVIQHLLTEAAVRFSLREFQSAPASNMMMLVNLRGLLERIAPELTRRRASAPDCPPFSLCLHVAGQTASITVKPSLVGLIGDEHTDAQLSCDANTFLRWVLGLNGFDEWQASVSHNLTRQQASVFAALFRREPCASGPWG